MKFEILQIHRHRYQVVDVKQLLFFGLKAEYKKKEKRNDRKINILEDSAAEKEESFKFFFSPYFFNNSTTRKVLILCNKVKPEKNKIIFFNQLIEKNFDCVVDKKKKF